MSGTAELNLNTASQTQVRLFSGLSLRKIIVVSIVLAFAAGYISGTMLGSKFATDRIRDAASNPKSHVNQVFLQMDQQLAFSNEQKTQATEILNRHFANSEQIRRENLPKVLAEFDRFADELHDVLDENQKGSWTKQSQWIKRNCYGVETHPAIK